MIPTRFIPFFIFWGYKIDGTSQPLEVLSNDPDNVFCALSKYKNYLSTEIQIKFFTLIEFLIQNNSKFNAVGILFNYGITHVIISIPNVGDHCVTFRPSYITLGPPWDQRKDYHAIILEDELYMMLNYYFERIGN